MHRSGTSLFAALLQEAGVKIGDRLIDGSEGNEAGHFEDVDVVQFHEDALRAQGLPPEGWAQQSSVDVLDRFYPRAEAIAAAKRRAEGVSGWKDPRTTLFLDFWAHRLPETVFLLLYRSPWEVMDSLYRRGDPAFASNPTFALQVWMAYNQALLRFNDCYPNRSLLFSINHVAREPDKFSDLLCNRLQVNLPLLPIADLFDPTRLHYQVSSTHHPVLVRDFFPEAIALLDELEHQNSFGWPATTPSWNTLPRSQNWILQDWLEARRSERQIRHAEEAQIALEQTVRERDDIKKRLDTTEQERNNALQSLDNTERERDNALKFLEETRRELESSRHDCATASAELNSLKQEVSHLQQEVSRLQQVIVWMQGSHFWRARGILRLLFNRPLDPDGC